jgi:hypothetical protein
MLKDDSLVYLLVIKEGEQRMEGEERRRSRARREDTLNE